MQAARLEPPIAAADTGRTAVHLALRALTGLSISFVLGVLFDQAGPANADRAPSIDVSRTGALIGDPFDLRVTGLAPQSTAEIVASITSSGVVWQSVATCKADKSGTIDLKTCDSTAGTYTGVDAGGLLWSMRPQSGNATSYVPPAGDQTIDYTIEVRISGTVRATAHFSRLRVKPDIVVRTMTTPFHGTVASPPDQKRRPAVILLGGSEGGDSMAAFAKLLAAHGYVAASVAYFGLPGLAEASSRRSDRNRWPSCHLALGTGRCGSEPDRSHWTFERRGTRAIGGIDVSAASSRRVDRRLPQSNVRR